MLIIDASHLSPQTVARDNKQANPTLPGAGSSPSTPPQSKGPVAFLFWKQRALQMRNLSLKVAKSESVAALETALAAAVRETFQAADKGSFVGAKAADECSKGEAVPASVEVPNLLPQSRRPVRNLQSHLPR